MSPEDVTVWVVFYWHDHGEGSVDSVWTTSEAARERVTYLGNRYCSLYEAKLDTLEAELA